MLKPKRNASLISKPLNRLLAVQDAEFLIHLPADFWEEAVQQMIYHPSLGSLEVKLLSSTQSICKFELRYAPATVNNRPVSVVIVSGSITRDLNFNGAFVQLRGWLQPLQILELNLIVAAILFAFLVIAAFIFSGEFNVGFIALTVPLAYIFTVSATLRYLWDKPALLIEIAREKLENANLSIIQPEFRKKKK